jgi:hypothetical protein
MGSSDSTGQFKITNVMPGRYLISTRPTSVRQLSPMLRPFGEDFDLVYPGVYLGGARERSAATVIRVPPGQETEADFSLTPEKAYSISGTIGGAFNGQPMLQLLDRDGDPITAGAERRQHQFTFRNVSPGDYIVSATTMGDRSGGGNAFGATPVAVSAADVKDVAVELSPGIDIPLEMTAPAAVHLKAVAGRGLPFSSFYSQQVQRDGQTAYQIPQVAPGSYKVLVQGTPADSYVSSIRSGNTDLLENALIVAPGVTPAPIQITFQSGAAHLEVTIQGSDPVSQYVLVVAPDGPLPAQLYSASSRMNSGSSGSGTSFTVTGLAPGSYRLYAFTSIDGIAYRDRESMRAFDNQAVSVNLSANETKKIELPLISGNRS